MEIPSHPRGHDGASAISIKSASTEQSAILELRMIELHIEAGIFILLRQRGLPVPLGNRCRRGRGIASLSSSVAGLRHGGASA
jgi:hypothetical protein